MSSNISTELEITKITLPLYLEMYECRFNRNNIETIPEKKKKKSRKYFSSLKSLLIHSISKLIFRYKVWLLFKA